MTNQKCSGCGVVLQSMNPQSVGYVIKEGQTLCQRCYRLNHYGDTQSFEKEGVDSTEVIKQLSSLEGTIVLVVDVSDIESSVFQGIRRHLPNREFIIVVTKKDLLPVTVSSQKILKLIQKRIEEESIRVQKAFLVSLNDSDSLDHLRNSLLQEKATTFIFTGLTNVGKSSLLNALTQSRFTVSPYAHTTLDLQTLEWYHHILVDTPGIRLDRSFLDFYPVTQQAKLKIHSRLKPITYRLKGNQCFIVDQLGDVCIESSGEASVTLYFSADISIHRTKMENRETYLSNHTVYDPSWAMITQVFYPKDVKMDLVFKSLGWFCVQGDIRKITVTSRLSDGIHLRKAMI